MTDFQTVVTFLLLVWTLFCFVIHSKNVQYKIKNDPIPAGKRLDTKSMYTFFPRPVIPTVVMILWIITLIFN
jgi:hypothetical protein